MSRHRTRVRIIDCVSYPHSTSAMGHSRNTAGKCRTRLPTMDRKWRNALRPSYGIPKLDHMRIMTDFRHLW